MGCGVSNVSFRTPNNPNLSAEETHMKLPSCRIVFSQQQLLKLNQKFLSLLNNDMEMEKTKEKQAACLGVVVERLVQRLVCNVGSLDSRFSSKFLINLQPIKNYNQERSKYPKFKYLVRLDVVSTPALYPDVFEPPIRILEGTNHKFLPQGYAKIRVHGEFLEQWAGFISSNGFLRRDKIQEKFLQLLTTAAAKPSQPFFPAQVDESRHCGSPGKIVDPITLSHILRCPASQQVFFGSDEYNESRFPDPRDFRIAIVEGLPETRLHVSFLSPTAQSLTSEVEISITLGIGVAGWPMGTDFPSRLPLDHVDFLLGYNAAQFDYYLVPKGPHPSVYCEDKFSLWEIRVLPTEMILEHHYSPTSVVARVYKILTHLLEILKARGVKTINKYILKNLLFFELEHKKRIQHWKPKAISRRVISILEKLLLFLKNQMVPSYFFLEKNILLQEDAFEDDYVSDRDILEHYVKQLCNDEFKVESDDRIDSISDKEELENVLLKKWDNVIANMLPPKSNKTKRLNVINNSPVVISYTRQQMEYVALLIREILKLKNIQSKNALKYSLNPKDSTKEESTDKEDFIYLLKVMLDQAKLKFLTTPAGSLNIKKTTSRKLLKLDQLLLSYDLSTAMLLDDIRRCKDMDYNFADDLSMVVNILECLYNAMDSDGKVLGPVLRPYLNQIFKGSHENCAFLFEWNKKTDLSEFEAIGVFSSLAMLENSRPLDEILNSAAKGWNWAMHCVQILHAIAEENSTKIILGKKLDFTESGLRLIFAPLPGKTIRQNVSIKNLLNFGSDKDESKNSTGTLKKKHGTDSRYSTIKSYQDVLESVISSRPLEKSDFLKIKGATPITNAKFKNEKQPLHVQLKEGNPFTLASMGTRRQGNHRGLGSIVQALISLQKLTVLQEISQYLPEDERIRVLSDIKKLSKEVHRVTAEKCRRKKSFSLSGRRNRIIVKKKSASSFSHRQIFQEKISKSFFAGIKTSEPQMTGIYKSINEFSISREKIDFQKEIKNREQELEEKVEKAKEESLRGTCRQLRKGSHPIPAGSGSSCTFPKAGFYRKGSLNFYKSSISTLNIKVSSQRCKIHANTTPFSNTLK